MSKDKKAVLQKCENSCKKKRVKVKMSTKKVPKNSTKKYYIKIAQKGK